MSNQHKKPILAFVVLAVIAAAMVGSQLRASADSMHLIAAGPISAHTGVTHGAIPLPAAVIDDNTSPAFPEHAPADPVPAAVPSAGPAAPAAVAHGAPRHPGVSVPAKTAPERPADPGSDQPAATERHREAHPTGPGRHGNARSPGQPNRLTGAAVGAARALGHLTKDPGAVGPIGRRGPWGR